MPLDLTKQFVEDYQKRGSELQTLESELEQAKRELHRLRTEASGVDGQEAERLKNKIRDLQRQVERLREQLRAANSRAEESGQELQEAETRIHELERELRSEKKRLTGRLDTKQEQLKDAQEELDDARKKIRNLEATADNNVSRVPPEPRPDETAGHGTATDDLGRCPHCGLYVILDDPDGGPDTPCLHCGKPIPRNR